jgi:hypothetical protein
LSDAQLSALWKSPAPLTNLATGTPRCSAW